MKPKNIYHFSVFSTFIVIVLSLAHCQTTQPPKPSAATVESKHPKIVNLGENFKTFWIKAKNKPFDDQVKIWDQVVEKPYQSFYDQIVWQKKDRSDWKEYKNKRLKEFFKKYNDRYSDIANSFDTFDKNLEQQIRRFKAKFSGTDFSVVFWAVPSPTFDGAVGPAPTNSNETIMAFGVDMTILLGSEIDTFFAHELFHVYHNAKMNNVISEKDSDNARLTMPLFLEGLATYSSGILNPDRTDDILLMSDDLAKVSPGDIMWLAKKFLEQANEKSFDEKKPDIYRNWFYVTGKVRSDLPNRCGYILGLKVIRKLAVTYKLEDMLAWNLPTIHQKVIEALRSIAKGPGAS